MDETRPRHGLKNGNQTGWKEGGRGLNRNPDTCPSEGPGSGSGAGRGKGRNRT